MSFKVVVEKEAEEDMKNAAQWIAQYSPDKATLWYFDATEAIESLENFPTRCPLAPESDKFGVEIRHLIFGKYRILIHYRRRNRLRTSREASSSRCA